MTEDVEVPDFFDTWVFEKITMFLETNGLEQNHWEDVDEVDGWDEFMQSEISKEQVPVYMMHYEGQETPCGRPYMLHIDNKSTEWDSWTIKFFSSFKEAKDFCKKKKLNLVKN